jgi:branched-chain amino acid transport system substrate-binding protein
MTNNWTIVTVFSVTGLVLASGLAFAAGQYGPGVSDTEIKIGNTMPYSGPASALGVFGKSETAYFAMINEQGGINGRKIIFISRDDGYSPPKTVEVVRQLVEEEHVLLLFNTAGTPTSTAIHDYLNDDKVPLLFCLERRRQVERSQALSLDDRLAAQLSHRGAHLRPLHSREPAQRQDRGALSER